MTFLSFVLGCFSSAEGQEYSIRHFNPESGLDGTFVYTTIEDSKGYKWIGTDYGLLRFDGLNFETIDQNDSTKTNFPTAAANIKSELILFGYYNGTIKEFNGINLQTIYTPNGNSGAVRSIVEDDNGIKWALTQNGGLVQRFDGNNELFSPKELLNKKSNVLVYQSNVLFVGTNEGIFIYQITDDHTPKYYGQIEALKGLSVQDMEKRPYSNTYWIGTGNDGIYQLIITDIRADMIKANAYQTDFLQDKSVVALKETKNKDLWISTKYSGLIKVNFNRDNTKPRQFTYMNQDNGFPGDQTSTLFFDQDDNIWVGTVGDGLVQVHKKGLIFYNFERFRARSVNCISGTKTHDFLFGTDVGLVKANYKTAADSLHFDLIGHDSVKGQNVTAIYTDPNDKVYFALKNKGLYFSDPEFKNISPLKFDHQTKRVKIRQITQDSEGFLWLSLMQNGVFVIDTLGNIKNHYATKTGFYHNEIYHIQIDSKGNKWFAAHSAGLAAMNPNGQIRYLTQEGKFPARDINDISEDERGNIWIGTYGNGVYEYDGENFVRFSTEEGLVNNYSNSVMSDRNNHIWVSHRTGLSRIDEYTNAVSTIEEKDGLTVSEFIPTSTYRDQDHNIWFGNRNGVTFLNGPDQMFEPKMLKTIITDVKIDRKSTDLYEFSPDEEVLGKIPTNMIFPYDHNNLTFDYIAINLKNPKSNLYQFKLNGYDKEWSPSTSLNSISYTNLNPGNYELLIRQSDNPNHWTDGNIAQLSFRILPSWWNTWWSRILFFGVAMVLIYGIIRIRTTELQRRLEEKKYFLEITENQNIRLKNFAFITSHNVRSSVVNLMGLIDIVESEPMNNKYFDLLRVTSEKLNKTIDHVSDLLNFENKTAEMEKVDCDVLETIERVIALNGQSIENNGAKIEVQVQKGTVVKAIPAYLESVYNNLITNAIRYGTTDTKKQIDIIADVNDRETVVFIKDYGLGIDMTKNRAKLFELGARFHSSKSDGQGFGLFMSKNQLETMGGKIEVESTLNEGTTVKVCFIK